MPRLARYISAELMIVVGTSSSESVFPRLHAKLRQLGADPGACAGGLQLDHVKAEPRMGKRAPSDARHLVTLCRGHHIDTGWATAHRPELREYLREVAS